MDVKYLEDGLNLGWLGTAPPISSKSSDDAFADHPKVRPFFHILNFTLICHVPFILVTNIVVIFTFYFAPKLRTPDNIVLVSLATADALSGITTIPIVVINYYDQNYFHTTFELCFLRFSIKLVMNALSLAMLTLLAVERFLAIRLPFWYHKNVSNKFIQKAIAFVIISFSIYLVLYGIHFTYSPDEKCTFEKSSPQWIHRWVSVSIYAVLMIVSIFCTIFAAIGYWEQITKIKKVEESFVNRERTERLTGNAKILISLMFLHVCLMLPSVILFFPGLIPDKAAMMIAHAVCHHLRYTNYSANALIYAFNRHTYKKAYRFLLTTNPIYWRELPHILKDNELFSRKMAETVKRIEENAAIFDTNLDVKNKSYAQNRKSLQMARLKFSEPV